MLVRIVLLSLFALCLPWPALAQPSLMEQEQAAFKAAAAHVAPSVVQIQTFGGLDRVGDVLIGQGPSTGLIVSSDGFIITSAFPFAAKPAAAVVTLADGRKLEAEIVATDYSRMLTLLNVEASGLPLSEPAPLDEARVGQWTLAVGKIFDIKVPNVSPGVLSAKNRIWGKAIQTDAKVSPFNYGGPLIDIRGRVLGVIVPLSMTSDGVMAGAGWYDSGIGFAIPIDQVLASVERLKAGEDLQRGVMGVATASPEGLFGEPRVSHVQENGPADKAGIQKDDLITAINGVNLSRVSDVKQQLGPHYAGDTITVTIQRGNQEKTLKVTLAEPTETSIIPKQEAIPQPGGEGGNKQPDDVGQAFEPDNRPAFGPPLPNSHVLEVALPWWVDSLY